MRAVVQRVKEGKVIVEGKTVGQINEGLLVLLGVGDDDNDKDLEYIVNKILGLRIFEDENGKMNLSVEDINGELLVVSQFTLYGDVRKGKRPSFTSAAHPSIAEEYYKKFISKCKELGIKTEHGVFGAHMDVSFISSGPVTILIDSKKTF